MEISKELQKKAKNITVLYAEDEKMIQNEVSSFLKRFFDHVDVADNGEEGLKRFGENKYDLVITDIKMPKLNGLQMVREIKKLDKNTKIIITSAFDDKKLLLNAIETSVDHYLVKPFDYSAFIVMLYKIAVVINLEKRVEKFNRHKQAILDFQENMVFTLKDKRITSANKKFLSFFQLDSIKEIYDKNINLADFVIKESGYYYPTDKYNWADDFYNKKEFDLLIKMLDKKTDNVRTFILKIGKLEEFDEIIITLTDISEYLESGFETKNIDFECFFFDKTDITRFFTFLKNEINRTKRYSLPLSVIQFKIDVGDIAEEQIDKLNKLIGRELEIMDFLAKPSDKKFIIVKINTDIADANDFAKKINSVLKKQLSDIGDFECNFGIVGLDSNDSMQDLLNRAERLIQSAKNSSNSNMKSDYFSVITPNFINQEKQLIFNKLLNCEKNKTPVKFISFLHGMKIADSAVVTFVSQKDEKASFRLSEKQCSFIDEKDKVFIEVDDYFAEVEADIEEQSLHDNHITLKNLNFSKMSPLKREYIRVSTDKNIPIKLFVDKDVTNGNILDISLKSVAVETSSIKNLTLGKIINVAFSIPMEKKKEDLNINAEVYKIEKLKKNYKIVLLLLADRGVRHNINIYISKRQQRIIGYMNTAK